MTRTLRRSAVIALLLLAVTAVAASAHPSFNPNQLPAGEAVDAVLVVPHGCNPAGGMPEEGNASPTIVLDLQLTEEIVAFETHELDGWEVERISEGEVVRWTATDGGTTEPIEFPVTLTIDGPVDEAFYLAAFQECEEGEFRWIGTPDQEAEFPAVKLTTTAGEIGVAEPEEAGHMTEDGDHEDGDDHAEGGSEVPSEGATATGGTDAVAGQDDADATAEDGVSWVALVVVVLVVAAGAAVLFARRSGGGGA